MQVEQAEHQKNPPMQKSYDLKTKGYDSNDVVVAVPTLQADRAICVGVSQIVTIPLRVPVTQSVEVRSAGNRQHSTELSLLSVNKKIQKILMG
jgi:hypothetical protein